VPLSWPDDVVVAAVVLEADSAPPEFAAEVSPDVPLLVVPVVAAGACASTAKELPIDTSTATPEADTVVSPAEFERATAP
jgi:hypothetical protein